MHDGHGLDRLAGSLHTPSAKREVRNVDSALAENCSDLADCARDVPVGYVQERTR